MRSQISHIEVMEFRETEFHRQKIREKELMAKEMQACLQLEKQLVEECQKNLKLEYEAENKRLEKELKEKSQKLSTILETESEGLTTRGYAMTSNQLSSGIHREYTPKVTGLVQAGVHKMPTARPLSRRLQPPPPTF